MTISSKKFHAIALDFFLSFMSFFVFFFHFIWKLLIF